MGFVGAALTESGTGIQLGTFPLGLRLGLREGVSIQLFGLSLGVHFFPLGIDLPVNPGRVGFGNEHREPRRIRVLPKANKRPLLCTAC